MPQDKVAMCYEIMVNIPLRRVLICSTFFFFWVVEEISLEMFWVCNAFQSNDVHNSAEVSHKELALDKRETQRNMYTKQRKPWYWYPFRNKPNRFIVFVGSSVGNIKKLTTHHNKIAKVTNIKAWLSVESSATRMWSKNSVL